MNQDLDPKYIIQSLVRQRDEALGKVAQLEAILLQQQAENAAKAEKEAKKKEEK